MKLLRRREIGKAGWGWTAFTGVVSLIYFFPVAWIIMTAFKTRPDALATPPKFLFTPTLDNFVRVFSRAAVGADQPRHRLQPVLLQLDLHRRDQRGAGADHRHTRGLRLLPLPRCAATTPICSSS